MAFLHLDAGKTTIRKYSATTTGKRSVIKVEIETDDSYRLHALLRDLEEAKTELDAAKKADAKPKRRDARQIEHREMLALPYLGED